MGYYEIKIGMEIGNPWLVKTVFAISKKSAARKAEKLAKSNGANHYQLSRLNVTLETRVF